MAYIKLGEGSTPTLLGMPNGGLVQSRSPLSSIHRENAVQLFKFVVFETKTEKKWKSLDSPLSLLYETAFRSANATKTTKITECGHQVLREKPHLLSLETLPVPCLFPKGCRLQRFSLLGFAEQRRFKHDHGRGGETKCNSQVFFQA